MDNNRNKVLRSNSLSKGYRQYTVTINNLKEWKIQGEQLTTEQLQALENLLRSQNNNLSVTDRIMLFKEIIKSKPFSRKEYLLHFKEISEPTASRDLKWGVENEILIKSGDKRVTVYSYKHPKS